MAGVRRFEMVEGSASKFWQVVVEGAAFTVTFGRIGTAGTSKTTTCASEAAAQVEADKLIREKTKKGYQELGVATENWRPPAHVGTDEHIERFLNYKVTGFDPEAEGEGGGEGERRDLPKLRELDKRAFRVGLSYDDDQEAAFASRLDALLADEKVGQLRALVIGQWFSQVCEEGPTVLFEKLIAASQKLEGLRGLFVGDIIQEECEISWIHQGDYGPLLRAIPQLEVLVVRGGDGLRFTDVEHARLRSLTVQTGGLSGEAVRDIVGARLPSLRELTLWLGVEDYGGTSEVADLAPLLSGERLPELEHLGLQNSQNMDAIAAAVARSPILERLKGLDLSMGTLTDEGASALLAAPAIRKLTHLNLRHHYLSTEMVKRIKALGIEVNTSDRKDTEDDDDRYAEVTE